MNVKDAKILAAESSLSDFNLNKSCAFMFEEVDKQSIPAPEIQAIVSNPASEDESLYVVRITFLGAKDLALANESLIKMMDTKNNVIRPRANGITIKDNRVDIEFEGIETGVNYFFNVAKGAFTYTFADIVREVGQVDSVLTGITTIYVDVTDEPLYDLQGRKVSGNLKSGIYIKNGKKVYIK